jgi:rSAM/selenodomain-associated transferase 2
VRPAEIAVIIPTLNEAAGIAETIASATGAGQVIVSDGESVDGTVGIAESIAGVRVVRGRRGRGEQLARGAALAELPVLLFLHADCRLGATALEQVARHFRCGSDRGWGAMRQRIESDGWRYRLLEWGNGWRVRYRGLPFGDQAMFVLRDWYDQAGGFEPIPLMEDLRLSQRLRRRSRPALLDGPVRVDSRRWRRTGVVRQTLVNWGLQAGHAAGVSPTTLAERYR